MQLRNHILFELEKLFNKNYCPFFYYNLPIPNRVMAEELSNKLLREELDYNIHELEEEHVKLFKNLNEQKIIYDAVLNAINKNRGRLFFVYGHGGTNR